MNAVFIVNPSSAGGATGRRIDEVRTHAERVFSAPRILVTQRPGHASELAAECGGAGLVVAVGGDGTANEIVNGLAKLDRAERPAFGVLPAGTGSDLVKTLHIPSDLGAAVRFLRNGDRKPTDWLRVRVGEPATEHICINVAGFGMNGEVVRRANLGSKRWGGALTFAVATLKTVARWRAPTVHVTWRGPAGDGDWTGPLASVFIANGQYCGGGMWVGRDGSMGDGVAEMTILPDLPISTMLRGAAKLYDGTIRTVPEVVWAQVHHLEAKAVSPVEVLVDLDGEQPGALPISVDLEASALAMVRG